MLRRTAWLLWCPLALSGEIQCNSLQEFVDHVYGNTAEPPSFVPLANAPHIAVAQNDSAILKIMDLEISHYPLKKGTITFGLRNYLTAEIPADSSMDLVSVTGGQVLFNGTLPICDYLTFADLECPIKPYKGPELTKQVLEIPEEAEEGRLCFISEFKTPRGQLIAHIAGLVDLKNDGVAASENDRPRRHDEL